MPPSALSAVNEENDKMFFFIKAMVLILFKNKFIVVLKFKYIK